MRLEVGKTYKTRGGSKVQIIAEVRADKSMVGKISYGATNEDVFQWKPNGTFFLDESECDLDIVEEWREPRSVTIDICLLEDKSGVYVSTWQGPYTAGVKLLKRQTITLSEAETTA